MCAKMSAWSMTLSMIAARDLDEIGDLRVERLDPVAGDIPRVGEIVVGQPRGGSGDDGGVQPEQDNVPKGNVAGSGDHCDTTLHILSLPRHTLSPSTVSVRVLLKNRSVRWARRIHQTWV
jgi:hypothetical protein